MISKKSTLIEFILEEIRMGNLKAGDKIFSRMQFMRKFQCARATIDKAIEELLNKNILESVKGKGTFIARQQKIKKTNTIAIISSSPNMDSMHGTMIHAMLNKLNVPLKTKIYFYNEISEPETWTKCKNSSIIVFIMPNILHNSFMNDCQMNNIPFTVMYRDPPDYSYVSIDNRGASAMLVKKLKELGFKRIGYFGLLEGKYHFPEERYAGFLEGLLENDLPLLKKFCDFSTQANIQSRLLKMLKQKNLPEILICSYFHLKDLLIVLEKLKIKPGKDLHIASLNPEDHDKYPFEVTCVKYALQEIGSKMGLLINKKFKDPNFNEQIKVIPKPF